MTRLRLLVSALALFAAAPAFAQSVTQPGALAADFELRLQQMEGQLQQMQGQIEQLQNLYATGQAQERQFRESVEYRLKALEGGAGGNAGGPVSGGAAMPPADGQPMPLITRPNPDGGMPIAESGTMGFGPVGQGAAPQKPAAQQGGGAIPGQVLGDPQQLYNYAYELITNQDYQGASAAFKTFMATYPKHELAGNAQYWLGETYFVNEDYKTAAVTFAEGFQKFPKGQKAADNLLKLGISLVRLKRNADACVAFAQLYAKFPDASPVIRSRAEQELGAINCQR